jgi:Ca2+-binding EF-hand superfamily protein
MKHRLFWRTAFFLFVAAAVQAAPRVALMDFSTDDNSYRSAQVAADFTSLLQSQLADEPGVEWVERVQLERARQELELSVMENMGSSSPMRLGKWAKADWMVTGQFSLDDRNQRTLFLEITDLQHADVLASTNLTFPDVATPQFQTTTNQVGVAAGALRQLFSGAHFRLQQTADKILVAPLFLAEVSPGFGFSRGNYALEQNFNEALERAVATNSRVRLIRFPKAYRSTEESEMVLDGLVEANRNAWQQAADLYVWGTYSVARKTTPGKPPEEKVEIVLHLWDGVSEPAIIKDELPDGAQPEQIQGALERLANQVIAHVHKRTTQVDAGNIRKKIAQSLVETYDQMTMSFHDREELGLHDPEKFLQAVHMLETACFFDPDNADARVLYITCRWGWWMDFTFKVKNEFWSKWRRSQAWERYVNRFGLKPVTEELPFPYQLEGGISAAYLRSLEDVLRMWDVSNREWAYNFPKDLPPEAERAWKTQIDTEHWKRLTKVAECITNGWTPQGNGPPVILSVVGRGILNADKSPTERLDLLQNIWPECVKCAQRFGPQWIISTDQVVDLCAQAGEPERGKQLLAMLSSNPPPAIAQLAPVHPAMPNHLQASSQMVPTPPWARDIRSFYSMFGLFPPNALPLEIQPAVQEFRFPSQFEVQTVDQMDFLQDKLLILAMDERSAQSSDANPDVSAETLAKRGRLWILEPGAASPILYEPQLFPETVHSFLLRDNRLWIAGKATGYLDLKTQTFRKFDLASGFALQEANAVGFVGDDIFVAGDFINVCKFQPAIDRWTELPNPTGSYGSDSPCLLTGNSQWLNYAAAGDFVYDTALGAWTNPPFKASVQCAVSDASGFWLGSRDGLNSYDPASKSFKHWSAPATFNGLFISMMGSSFMGNSETSRRNLERMDEQIQGLMKKLQADRTKNHAVKSGKNAVANPLHLDWRVPGEVTALANDGDFLWVGVGNFFGNYLLLLHKPSGSVVAYCPMQARDKISSLAISKTSVWIGTAYGDHKLLQIPKNSFASIPQNRWVSLAVSPEERDRLVKNMSVRDQAMYAFYAGDDARVAALLEDIDPDKASLEQMFLLAFSYDALGLDKPDLVRTWFENIISRYPDSPWAKAAQAALSENEQNHKTKAHQEKLLKLLAKYDLNHDGILDPDEKRAMEKDPDYQQENAAWDTNQLDAQLKEIMQKYDLNGDGKLDRDELERLKVQVNVFSQASPEMLAGHKIPLAPLISKNFPTVSTILQKYDTNSDGGLEIDELKHFAEEIQNNR